MDKPDLRAFPDESGVYLYKDAAGRIIYVGKARRLRRRIASYFRAPEKLPAKSRLMLGQAARIDILRTTTEKEALLLEASLIKKHRPRFNIVLRDDKEYLLFRIGSEHLFPRVEIARAVRGRDKDKGARHFGPYSSGLAARETWRLIHKYFPLRRCRDAAFANRSRPCLYYDMGQCLGPCVLPVAPEAYRAVLDKVLLLLAGRPRELVTRLRKEMAAAARDLRFEEAARLRDQIRAVERTLERQSVVLLKDRDLDAVGLFRAPQGLALAVLFVRGGQLLDGRNFFWPGLDEEDMPELLNGFLAQYYLERRGFGESMPPRIVVPRLPESGDGSQDSDEEDAGTDLREGGARFQALEAALAEIRGGELSIALPRGADEKRLVAMAVANAAEAAQKNAAPCLAESLAARFRAPRPIRRIEVVDISHTGGSQTRAGMVVFEDQKPVKGDFRVYKLDPERGGDDYAALAAWAARRAARSKERPWPDLILIDGGRGQLAAVGRAFAEAGVSFGAGPDQAFMLAAIAKARDEEGRADRRAGNVADRIFLPGRSNPLALAPGSPELLYLQRLRDAAHDFAIGRHRRARSRAALESALTAVPGIGPALARTLFEHFGSLEALAGADDAALLKVPGIGAAKAGAIAGHLARWRSGEA
ncbi:excinuclease ABC subunit UvrC [Desulfovibrio sp. OttesenSCG-928-G11]|nr:excinuclease ABC subunit UvrC [Desulfovibrio sp. OttesenSCG-928-G11]